ncbi:hypothetical protein [Methanolapillus africanus]|uniref:hypothetical protein n=1 Tax=Methanolapillus africanus TaxID=3028297 RepID=UPI0030B917DC
MTNQMYLLTVIRKIQTHASDFAGWFVRHRLKPTRRFLKSNRKSAAVTRAPAPPQESNLSFILSIHN